MDCRVPDWKETTCKMQQQLFRLVSGYSRSNPKKCSALTNEQIQTMDSLNELKKKVQDGVIAIPRLYLEHQSQVIKQVGSMEKRDN